MNSLNNLPFYQQETKLCNKCNKTEAMAVIQPDKVPDQSQQSMPTTY